MSIITKIFKPSTKTPILEFSSPKLPQVFEGVGKDIIKESKHTVIIGGTCDYTKCKVSGNKVGALIASWSSTDYGKNIISYSAAHVSCAENFKDFDENSLISNMETTFNFYSIEDKLTSITVPRICDVKSTIPIEEKGKKDKLDKLDKVQITYIDTKLLIYNLLSKFNIEYNPPQYSKDETPAYTKTKYATIFNISGNFTDEELKSLINIQ